MLSDIFNGQEETMGRKMKRALDIKDSGTYAVLTPEDLCDDVSLFQSSSSRIANRSYVIKIEKESGSGRKSLGAVSKEAYEWICAKNFFDEGFPKKNKDGYLDNHFRIHFFGVDDEDCFETAQSIRLFEFDGSDEYEDPWILKSSRDEIENEIYHALKKSFGYHTKDRQKDSQLSFYFGPNKNVKSNLLTPNV